MQPANTSFRARLTLAAALAVIALARAADAQVTPDPLDLKVVDRETGQVLPVWRHHGRLFVAGQPGERYGLRVTNHTDRRVLVVMSVDGVNIMSGETAGLEPARLHLRAARGLRHQRLAQIRHRDRRLRLRAAAAVLRRADRAAARRGRDWHRRLQREGLGPAARAGGVPPARSADAPARRRLASPCSRRRQRRSLHPRRWPPPSRRPRLTPWS